ncbi:hypothetical protein [Parasitella parasitica]|uniref:Zn(2)-C6 fungal-type domain-containing protein n=1 Tax=Parasitella parasitica TaxID=35722 RepID=A0A0B7N318_9FUNG|nr:hypothetical protein [Parasitella parasitica]
MQNTLVQKQARPFVYIQYANNSSSSSNNHQQRASSPSDSSSSSCSLMSTKNSNNQQQQEIQQKPKQEAIQEVRQPTPQPQSQQQQQQQQQPKDEPQPKKKKRQHVGYACDKCRERRVGCDRGKPICGQCKDRYHCQYSNHALRLDNVSMRQRLDELENQVGWLTSFVTALEQDYRSTIPKMIQPPVQHHVAQQEQQEQQQQTTSAVPRIPQKSAQFEGPSVYEWAVGTGWPVVENTDGMKSIFTTIKNFEDLSEALRNTVETIYNAKGNPLYRQPDAFPQQFGNISRVDISLSSLHHTPSFVAAKRTSITSYTDELSQKEHTFTLFESLNRYAKSFGSKGSMEASGANDEQYLTTDVKTRIIHQHHKCGFPTLVSPSRFENHYRQGQLKPLVLSSVFSHSVPHCCLYHPHLTQIQDFRELGSKFYNHSHDLLGIDEPANLSNIHQRTLLITYDLDLGRVRRAFLHIGIAIRMCFMLNLHRPEGYLSCKTPFEREQSKRIFWTVWFYDNMVSHLFHDQLSTIKLSQIAIELPTPLPEFNAVELDQTTFAVSLIRIRKLAGAISEESRKMRPRDLVDHFREKLLQHYHSLPKHLQFGSSQSQSHAMFPPDASVWQRRNYFCILLDYCQCWISMYRALLPSAAHHGEKALTSDQHEAILHTSQAAVAILQLFQSWFMTSSESEDKFDCFFRPYLYHFMSAKHIFSSNVAEYGRSPALVYVSRACLVLLLRLYQITPTRRSFDESQLEKDMLHFLNTHQIGPNEIVYQAMIDEALMDDPNADGGWSIFSYQSAPATVGNRSDDMGSKCSSNDSIRSDPCVTEVDLDYF